MTNLDELAPAARPACARVLATLTFLAALAAASPSAQAGRGGKSEPQTNAVLTLADRSGDAVQSDGRGGYDTLAYRDGSGLTLSTGRKRAFLFDLSTCLAGCDGPYDLSGLISDVTMWAQPSATIFEFNVAGGRWRLLSFASMTGLDDDVDGVIDRFVLEDDGTSAALLTRLVGYGIRGEPAFVEYGEYALPWKAEVTFR